MSVAQILLLNAGLILAALFSIWLVSLRLADASIVDIFWGLGFVMVAWVTFLATDDGARAPTLTWLTTVWGVRLSGYLAWRNIGRDEDARYQAMRAKHDRQFWWVSLFTVFGLQGVVMWIVALPIQVGQINTSAIPVGWLNYVGVAVWGLGFIFEAVGDFQLARFKADSGNQAKVMDRGLWRYTRHPNYFGNALVWWGLFLVAVTPATIWLVVSPILMNFLLLKVSGVPLLENSLKRRSAAYQEYTLRTSPFLPRPPKTISDRQSGTLSSEPPEQGAP